MECDLKMGEYTVCAIGNGDEGRLRIPAGGEGKFTYAFGCGTSRAYIGLSDDGSNGEGSSGRSIYHTMAEVSD